MALGLFLPLPETGTDLTQWNHWRMPAAIPAEFDDRGPVLVTVDLVDSDRVAEFMKTIHEYGRVRRRDGASRWGICRDLLSPALARVIKDILEIGASFLSLFRFVRLPRFR
jgi:hypothetical protein